MQGFKINDCFFKLQAWTNEIYHFLKCYNYTIISLSLHNDVETISYPIYWSESKGCEQSTFN